MIEVTITHPYPVTLFELRASLHHLLSILFQNDLFALNSKYENGLMAKMAWHFMLEPTACNILLKPINICSS
jgi:hypothetical protein